MLPRNHPDRIKIAFDDHRLVANAGLLLPATLALHLGLSQLVQQRLDLGDAPGRANTGDKMMTLVASALAGGIGDGAQPGPLDSPHRPGSADRDHQDPQPTGLCLGRTDHPLGTPIDPASATALALGGAVQPRHGPAASHSTPSLTAPSATGPPANLPSTQIRARIIAPVTPSPPSAVLTPSIPVHRWIRA